MDERLIVTVSKYRELYDTSLATYKNMARRDSIWKEISRELNIPVDICKTRWKNLRHDFVKCCRTTRLEQGSEIPKRKTWRFYRQMEFLCPYIGKKPQANFEGIAHIAEDISETEGSLIIDFEGGSPSPSQGSCPPSPYPPTPFPDDAASVSTTISASAADKILELLQENKWERMERERERQLQCDDPMLCFFITVWQTVKTFPPHLQTQVKSRIFQIVTEVESQMLNSQFLPASRGRNYYPYPPSSVHFIPTSSSSMVQPGPTHSFSMVSSSVDAGSTSNGSVQPFPMVSSSSSQSVIPTPSSVSFPMNSHSSLPFPIRLASSDVPTTPCPSEILPISST